MQIKYSRRKCVKIHISWNVNRSMSLWKQVYQMEKAKKRYERRNSDFHSINSTRFICKNFNKLIVQSVDQIFPYFHSQEVPKKYFFKKVASPKRNFRPARHLGEGRKGRDLPVLRIRHVKKKYRDFSRG